MEDGGCKSGGQLSSGVQGLREIHLSKAHAITDQSFAHRDIDVHPHTESMRFVRHQSNSAVTKCNVLHFWCDM